MKPKRLTDKAIQNAKPGAKIRKLFDGHGLHMAITPTGARYWRLKYYVNKAERLLSLGVYPTVSLAAARDLAEAARKQIADGVDPAAERAAAKAKPANDTSFESVARLWLAHRAPHWKPGHRVTVTRRLENHIFPKLGALPIKAVDAATIAKVINTIEDDNGTFETARRCCQYTGSIIRHAIRKRIGGVESDPTPVLRDGFTEESKARKERHHPAITDPAGVGALMRAIAGYNGSVVVKSALKLHALTALRPGELRKATWAEIDFETATWRVPAVRMKGKDPKDHIVHLSRQATKVLERLYRVTGDGPYIFPSGRGQSRPLSENGATAALRAMGYFELVPVTDKNGIEVKGKDGRVKKKPVSTQSAHGFRSIFSTRLNELGERPDLIERQLAHHEPNAVRKAYNHAEHIDERRRLMQRWADYLDQLAAGTKPKEGTPPAHGLRIVSKTSPADSPFSAAIDEGARLS